jgi:GAF domain-containing protein
MSTSLPDRLAAAEATIVALRQENERLRRRVDDEQFAAALRQALVLAASTGTIGSPLSQSRLLELIVETAIDVIDARAAHLFLVDEDADELVFVVAVGPHQAEVEQRRVPLAHGLAGLAVVGGQPISVADARQDPRLASEVAQFLGYVPDSILCVPLFLDDRVVGVLELLDKEGDSPFSQADIAHLGLFANLAAVAITQSRVHDHLGGLIGSVLSALGDQATPDLSERAKRFAVSTEEANDINFREALELANLVREIAWHGEDEHRACLHILQGFAGYLRSRPQVGVEQGTMR